MIPLLLAACIGAFALNSICTRLFQLRVQKNGAAIQLYQGLFCLVAALAYLLSGLGQRPDGGTVRIGMLFGMFFCMAVYCMAGCFACGPMSLTGILINMSMLLPILYSCLFLKEKISAVQVMGIALLAVTFILSAQSTKEGQRQISFRWIGLVSLGFLSNGMTAVLQKHYKSAGGLWDAQFMATAYFTASLLFLIFYVAAARKKGGGLLPAVNGYGNLAGLSLVSGLGSFAGNGILMFLSAKVAAPVLYPCVNGGLCLVLAAVSFTRLKEKPTAVKLAAIATGTAAIVVLNL